MVMPAVLFRVNRCKITSACVCCIGLKISSCPDLLQFLLSFSFSFGLFYFCLSFCFLQILPLFNFLFFFFLEINFYQLIFALLTTFPIMHTSLHMYSVYNVTEHER